MCYCLGDVPYFAARGVRDTASHIYVYAFQGKDPGQCGTSKWKSRSNALGRTATKVAAHVVEICPVLLLSHLYY